MSWDISLEEEGQPVDVDLHAEGGSYDATGSTKAELNVTYNYGKPAAEVGFSFRDLAGQRAGLTIQALSDAVETLGTKRDPDYWAATRGNTGFAASILLRWARANANAIWSVV